MNIAEIRRLVKLVETSKIDELEIEEEGVKIRIAKNAPPDGQVQHFVSMPAAQTMQPMPAGQPVPVQAQAPGMTFVETSDTKADSLLKVDSPMVGTFYRAQSPEAPPYVQVGDQVKIGQVLCIIEAMKLMNEIEAEVSGKLVEIHVENAEPVEFGQILFSVEPT